MVQYDLMGRNQGPTRNHIRPTTSKRNTPSCEPFFSASLHHPCPNQPGKSSSSAVGSFWAVQLRTPRMPIVPVSWKHDWTYSGLKIGLLYGPWYVLNATFPPPPKHVRGQRLNKRKLEFAKLLRLPGRARKAERWQQHAMRRQYLSPGRSFRKSRASTQLILTQRSHLLLESHTYSQRRSWNSSRSPSNECHVLVNRGPLGMRAEHWYDFGTQAGGSDLFARIIAHIATATIPDVVLQYLRAGQVTPLAKPTGGHRPLLMMSFLRRLALKSRHCSQEALSYSCSGPTPARSRLQGRRQQDDQIHHSSFAEADQSLVSWSHWT